MKNLIEKINIEIKANKHICNNAEREIPILLTTNELITIIQSLQPKEQLSAEEVLFTTYQSVLGDITREEFEELKVEDSEEGRMFRATIQAMHDFSEITKVYGKLPLDDKNKLSAKDFLKANNITSVTCYFSDGKDKYQTYYKEDLIKLMHDFANNSEAMKLHSMEFARCRIQQR